MDLIRKYKKYRRIGTRLNHKMMRRCLTRDILTESGRLLGILQGDVLVFDDMDETSILMDFALNDYRIDGKNIVQIYREKIGGKNAIEKDILNSLLSSYTSLFRIMSVSKNTLLLTDILNRIDNIELTDISFSRTAFPGLLLFTRLISFKDFNKTSGVSFVFPGHLEGLIIRKYRKMRKKVKSDNDSVKRYVAFFRLSKTYGLDVGFA